MTWTALAGGLTLPTWAMLHWGSAPQAPLSMGSGSQAAGELAHDEHFGPLGEVP
jgi:hypothetical protein